MNSSNVMRDDGTMSADIRHLLLRLLGVAIVAAVMGVIGWVVVERTTGVASNGIRAWVYRGAVSVALWLALSFALRHASLPVTVGVGALSPFIGAGLMCPGLGAVLIATMPQAILVGIATALLVRPVVNWDAIRAAHRRRRGLCHRCGCDLRGSEGAACSECGAPATEQRPATGRGVTTAVLIGLLTALVVTLFAWPPTIAASRDDWRDPETPQIVLNCISTVLIAVTGVWVAIHRRRIERPRGSG